MEIEVLQAVPKVDVVAAVWGKKESRRRKIFSNVISFNKTENLCCKLPVAPP